MTSELIVQFPLQGEWFVGADGTEAGHELAFDFIRLDRKLRATRKSSLHELLTAVPLEQYLGWGQPIVSPFEGRVVTAVDGHSERSQSFIKAMFESLSATVSPSQRKRLEALQATGGDIGAFAGNHLVIESAESEGVFAFMAHARTGSIIPRIGDPVCVNQQVAEVGNSGQSVAPHLHFHLMSDPSPNNVQVIPFKFARYEVYLKGEWSLQEHALPKKRQRIRSVPTPA
ncbi:hypothetical protein ACFPIF_17500 [Brevundimonas faecalis]|uniref:hypothetical protein n=1 Tax=Brevundimonas faecalis TaxID=947378 RepID=UPI0036060FAC